MVAHVISHLIPTGVSPSYMKGERIRFQQTGEFHFLTFSCFHRRPYLSSWALQAAEKLCPRGLVTRARL